MSTLALLLALVLCSMLLCAPALARLQSLCPNSTIRSLDTLVDVDSVIVSVGELTQGRKCSYRRVTLVDHTIDVENAVTLALWREQAIHFKGTEGELLRFQASKVTSYLKSYRHIGSLSHESIT